MKKYLPNALSIFRIVISPIILLTIVDLNHITFITLLALVVLAVFSDWADGFLARRWQLSSGRGYVLDAMGDRAVHLALILVVFSRYDINPMFIWLLVFRDIAIYGIRLLSAEWLQNSRDLQWISRFHATNIRIWIGSYLLRDGIQIFWHSDYLDNTIFEHLQYGLLIATIILSYWGLALSLNWILGEDKRAI